jgi:hypothetical protein
MIVQNNLTGGSSSTHILPHIFILKQPSTVLGRSVVRNLHQRGNHCEGITPIALLKLILTFLS